MNINENMNIYDTDFESFLKLLLDLETPSLVYNMNQLESVVNKVKVILRKYESFILNFALKSCYNNEVLKYLVSQEIGCDVASKRELQLAQKMKFKHITSTSPYYSVCLFNRN